MILGLHVSEAKPFETSLKLRPGYVGEEVKLVHKCNILYLKADLCAVAL